MDERMLKAMVAAGAIKNINIIASGARFHVEAKTPNGPITAETRKGKGQDLGYARRCRTLGTRPGDGRRTY